MEATIQLAAVDWLIIALYFVAILGIGLYLKRFADTKEDFFEAGRRNSSWVAGLAFVSANLGALEILGWTGGTIKYGMFVSHFYWIGAIPAMLFLGLFMMPFYYSSKIHSIPGYLLLRFDEKTRVLNAIAFAVMTVLDERYQHVSDGAGVSCCVGMEHGCFHLDQRSGGRLLHHVGRADVCDFYGNRAVFPDLVRFVPRVAARYHRSGRIEPDLCRIAGHHGRVVVHRRGRQPQRHGRYLGGNRARSGIRAVFRLLDHRLPAGTARFFGQGSPSRTYDPDHRRVFQDDPAVYRRGGRFGGVPIDRSWRLA